MFTGEIREDLASYNDEIERMGFELEQTKAEIEAITNLRTESKLKKLLPVWRRIQKKIDQVADLTLKEFRDFTGHASPPARALTPDGKHVLAQDALDSVVSEYGFENTEALMNALNSLGDAVDNLKKLRAHRDYLNSEIKYLEQERLRAIEAAEVEALKAFLIKDILGLQTQLNIEVEAAKAGLKGVKGEEARIGRDVIKGLERELRYARNTLLNFKQRPGLPDATVLRSTIMAWANYKGLAKKTIQDVFHSVAGTRHLKSINQENLLVILEKMKKMRPKKIKSKTVITAQTEKKIQTLKAALIGEKKLTEKIFNHLVRQLDLKTTSYESKYRFITNKEGRELIRAMNDEAVIAEYNIAVEEALDKNPKVKKARDELNRRSILEPVNDEALNLSRLNEFFSFRYYTLEIQKRTGNAPIYDIWWKINMATYDARAKQTELINRLDKSVENFKSIATDPKALKRIEDYIASEDTELNIKRPVDITEEEIKLAEEFKRQLFEFQPEARFARFMENYLAFDGDIDLMAREIPNAPRAALRRAMNIYEGKGQAALREFLDTQKWGVKEHGYSPKTVVKPRLYGKAPRSTTFGKGHIKTRTGIEYNREDRDILQRYRSYQKQIMGLTDLAPLVRAFDRVFTENASKLEDPMQAAEALSRGINTLKGYQERGGFLINIADRIYSQVASSVFWRPDLAFRNKFQNPAFNSDWWAGYPFDPRNKPLSADDRLWFEYKVSQQKGLEQDFLLFQEKPYPPFGSVTKWARRTSLYPWSDKSNRAEAYYVRMNRVERALQAYEKTDNLDELIRASGLNELELRQQAQALELLKLDEVNEGIEGLKVVTGRKAFQRFISQQHVANVHFQYNRGERAPAEQGPAGKTLGNIIVFNRSWGERLLLQARKISSEKTTMAEKTQALRVFVGIIVCGLIAGTGYKKLTGKKNNPYNPLNIFTWQVGGLQLGAIENIQEVFYLITAASQGDKYAQAQLPYAFTNALDTAIPFYKHAVQALESLYDMKGIDRLAVQQMRAWIDAEYEVRGGEAKIERSLIEKLQHAILSGKDEPDTPEEKVFTATLLLGEVDEDWIDRPYSTEDPDLNTMRDLNSEFGRIFKNLERKDFKGYSLLVDAWFAKEEDEKVYEMLPNVKLYRINGDPAKGDTFEEYYQQWQLILQTNADPELLEQFKKENDGKTPAQVYDKAYKGNMTRRMLELLREYNELDSSKAKSAFRKANPILNVDLRDEWLKENPVENAQLALWGQAKILTEEAFEEFNKLVKDLDIPDTALVDIGWPPEEKAKGEGIKIIGGSNKVWTNPIAKIFEED